VIIKNQVLIYELIGNKKIGRKELVEKSVILVQKYALEIESIRELGPRYRNTCL
jgi:hypothetical protein